MAPQPSLEEQREFWEWHWSHEAERKTRNEWKDARHGVILDCLRTLGLATPRILDVGCGSGWYTASLTKFGPTTGIDLSAEAIGRARSRCPEATFVAGDYYTARLAEGSFDVVVAQEVFDHVQDQPRFVARTAALLRPGGCCIVSCTNAFVYDRLWDGAVLDDRRHIKKHLRMREFVRLFLPHFRIVARRSVLPVGNRGVLRAVNSPRLTSLVAHVTGRRRLDHWKEGVGLGYQNILLARRR